MFKPAIALGSVLLLSWSSAEAMADHPHRSHRNDGAALILGGVLSLIADHDDHAHGHRHRLADQRGHRDHARARSNRHRHDHGSRQGGALGFGHAGHNHGTSGIHFQLSLGGGGPVASVAPAPLPVNHLPALGPAPLPLPADAPHFGGYCVGCEVPAAVPVYPHVRVKDARNIAPGAVPRLIAIRDPRDRWSHQCVFVEVCMPPCDCHDISVSRDGRRVKYDFGDYEIEVTSRNGLVTVDYDD